MTWKRQTLVGTTAVCVAKVLVGREFQGSDPPKGQCWCVQHGREPAGGSVTMCPLPWSMAVEIVEDVVRITWMMEHKRPANRATLCTRTWVKERGSN